MRHGLIRSRLLLSTATLLAGMSFATAQGMKEEGGGHAASHAGASSGISSGHAGAQASGGAQASPHAAGGPQHSAVQSEGPGKTAERSGEGRGAASAEHSRTEGMGHQGLSERGHAQSAEQRGHAKQRDEQQLGRNQSDRNQAERSPAHQGRTTEQANRHDRSTTTGQASPEESARDQHQQGLHASTQKNQQRASTQQKNQHRASTQQQNQQKASAQQNEQKASSRQNQQQAQTSQSRQQRQTQSQQPEQSQSQAAQRQTTTGQAQARAGAPAQSLTGRTTVTAQQQTKLQQSVLSSHNAPRVNVNHVNFAISAGSVVPRHFDTVSVHRFPVLAEMFPDYASDSFFIVDDEVVFLDSSRRIVDVVPAGPRVHYSSRESTTGSGGYASAVDLSPVEVREVQRVLIDEGFYSGEVDGVFGPHTREALISFQRQRGIQATGSVNTRTVAALGLSNRFSAQGFRNGGQATTTGQGGAQQPSGRQRTNNGPAHTNAPARQAPSTTGQGGTQQQPAARQNQRDTHAQPGDRANAPEQHHPSTTGQGTHAGGHEPPASHHVGENTGPQNQRAGQGQSEPQAQSQPSMNRHNR